MPRCLLNTEFLEKLQQTTLRKKVIFSDVEYRTLQLEYRPSGTGTWYFRGKDEKGMFKQVRLGSLDDMDLLEARAQVYELQKYLAQGGTLTARQARSAKKITFRNFVELHYLPHAQVRKRSWYIEGRVFERHIFPHFGEQKLDSISRISLTLWQESLRQKGLAEATCNRLLYLMKYVFNCARRWDFLEDSPARDIYPLPEREFRERYLSEEEAQRLLNSLASEPGTLAIFAIQLLLFTGARKTEILSARWEHIDMKRRILTVPLSKSGHMRHIPLSDAALNVLRKMRRRRSGWIFPSPKSDSHITNVYSTWDRIRKRAGLQDVRLHDLRHSFASFLVNSGCSLYEVQKILGHHDPKMTTRYAHLAQKSLLKAANLVSMKLGKRRRRARKGENAAPQPNGSAPSA